MNWVELEKLRYKKRCPEDADNWRTNTGDTFGLFYITRSHIILKALVAPMESDWQHVSVSVQGLNRCPTWEEMCFVKNLVWGQDVTVIQFHPKQSEYVNKHKYCLHMWKKSGIEYELPPSILVG